MPEPISPRIPLGSALDSRSGFEQFALQPDPEAIAEEIGKARDDQLYDLEWNWRTRARDDQLPPPGDWTT